MALQVAVFFKNYLTMAYNTKDMISQCVDVIKKNKLVFIEEIPTFVKFGKTTFYARKLNESEEIKKELENNKVDMKAGLRKTWYKSKNALLQITLYKLIASEKEYDRISTQKLDHTSGGEKIQPLNITVAEKSTTDKLQKLINEPMSN